MIKIILKCQNKNICKNVYSFHHYLKLFLSHLTVFAPFPMDHLDRNPFDVVLWHFNFLNLTMVSFLPYLKGKD